jgi:hypothetical protein
MMRSLLASKDIPHRTLEMIGGRVRKVHHIHCSKCDNEGRWTDAADSATTPQKVIERFRRHGWGIGRDRTRDICPSCLAAERVAHKHFKPKERPLMAEAMLPLSAPAPEPEPMEALAAHPLALVPPEPPPEPTPASAAQPAPAAKLPRKVFAHTPIIPPGVGGRGGKFLTRGFTREENAYSSARSYLMRTGVAKPVRDQDFRVFELLGDGWGWDLIAPPAAAATPPVQEEKPMSEPDPRPELRVVEPAPQADGPNREQRRIIRRYIEESYDQDAQRWRGDLSDEKVGRHFAIPAAWVTQVREDGDYGPDVNEAAKDITKEIGDLEGLRDLLTQAIEALKAKAH